jgi:hypothetical protein
MGALGKTLVFLNVLAAGAFIYLATADWSKRQAWTEDVFRHELAIQGLPLQAPEGAEDSSGTWVPFHFNVSDSVALTEIRRTTLEKHIPAGGAFGGGVVTNQTDEVKRLQTKVRDTIGAADGLPAKIALLRTYLLNLAESGAERDGINALLRDLLDQRRFAEARRELPLLGSTPAQVAALTALVRLGDLHDDAALQSQELVVAAKKALDDAARTTRLIYEAPGGGGAAEPLRLAAELADNNLADRNAVNTAQAKLQELVAAQAQSAAEKEAMSNLLPLLVSPPTDVKVAETAEKVGEKLLDARFEAALVLASTTAGGGKGVRDPDAKALAIAHLLYHIDAHQPWDDRRAWHERVQRVVGMTNYVRAADAQATALADMAQRLQGEIKAGEAAFQAEYQALVHRAMFLATQFDDVQSRLDEQKRLAADHDQILKNREQEFVDLDKDLKKARVDAKQVLADLRKDQADLYQLNLRIREAQDNLFQMESRVKALEEKVTRKNESKPAAGNSAGR